MFALNSEILENTCKIQVLIKCYILCTHNTHDNLYIYQNA